MRIIFLILMVGMLFSSCNTKEKNKDINDFSFYLPEADLYITTSKRVGGTFYVMFSKTDSASVLSDSVDYIECQIEDQTLVVIFDPNNRNDIHFMYPYVKKTHEKNLNLIKMEPNEFTEKFYHLGIRTTPDTLKNPYKKLIIIPMSYLIILQRDSTFDSQVRMKEGNMWGR